MKFVYHNHNNEDEVEVRDVEIDTIGWRGPGTRVVDRYGYAPGWFITGHDRARNRIRSFALDPARMQVADGYPSEFQVAEIAPVKDAVDQLIKHMGERPLLGLATNKQLQDELMARHTLGHTYDDYRPAGGNAANVERHTSAEVAAFAGLMLSMDDDEMRKSAVVFNFPADDPEQPHLTPDFCRMVRSLAASALSQVEG